jgi:hypothetical protein
MNTGYYNAVQKKVSDTLYGVGTPNTTTFQTLPLLHEDSHVCTVQYKTRVLARTGVTTCSFTSLFILLIVAPSIVVVTSPTMSWPWETKELHIYSEMVGVVSATLTRAILN